MHARIEWLEAESSNRKRGEAAFINTKPHVDWMWSLATTPLRRYMPK